MSDEEIEKVKMNLETKGRAILEVNAKVLDSEEAVTMLSKFTWYVQLID